MPTALVTGAYGCVGSALAIRLHESGVTVRTYTRKESDTRVLAGIPLEPHTGDICDAGPLRRAMEGCNVVYHTAAVVTFARRAREEQRRVNVLGTRTVVRCCLDAGIGTLVHTSSVTAIGTPPEGLPADETFEPDRTHARGYKLSKILAEDEVREGVSRGLRAVIVNPSVVVGERDTHFHAGSLIRDIKRGLIPFYVSGGMNIVYVGDVASGMIAAAARGRTGERYILAGDNLTHQEIFRRTAALIGGRPPLARFPLPLLSGAGLLVEAVSGVFGVEPPLTRDLASVAGRYHWFTSAKAGTELGFSATAFDRTIMAAYDWYRQNGYL
jgi:dihydroflavonol-4-reductase